MPGLTIYSDGSQYYTQRGIGGGAAGSGGGGGSEAVNAQTGTSYTVVNGDSTKLVTFSNTSSVAVTLPQAGSGGNFATGWYADFQNRNSGVVTITPTTSTIDNKASITLGQYQGVRICSDGSNYFTVRGGALLAYGASVGPDAPPQVPNAMDDEFNGTSLNTSLWTWVNQGTASAVVSNSIFTIDEPSPQNATNSNRCIQQSTPGTPWQVVTKMTGIMPWPSSGNNRAGMFVSDGTKFIFFSILITGLNTCQILIQRFSTITTFSATSTQYSTNAFPFYYLSIKDDGTNLNYYVSYDGVNYWLQFQEARTAFLASVSKVGLFSLPLYATSTGSSGAPRLADGFASFDYFRRTL